MPCAQPAACCGGAGGCAGGALTAIRGVTLPDFRWTEEFQPKIQCFAFSGGVSGV